MVQTVQIHCGGKSKPGSRRPLLRTAGRQSGRAAQGSCGSWPACLSPFAGLNNMAAASAVGMQGRETHVEGSRVLNEFGPGDRRLREELTPDAPSPQRRVAGKRRPLPHSQGRKPRDPDRTSLVPPRVPQEVGAHGRQVARVSCRGAPPRQHGPTMRESEPPGSEAEITHTQLVSSFPQGSGADTTGRRNSFQARLFFVSFFLGR